MTPAPDALIGHTGFVGGSLARCAAFPVQVNSATVDSLRGGRFGLVVCAGVSAVKWQANRDPDADRAGIARLTDALARATIAELVLISTIDVYPDPGAGGDEATPIDAAATHAYGRHRAMLEEWCRARFPRVRVVRLPALFGPGLRKNALFDLMHGHMLGTINPAASFQWYPLGRLWSDIGVVRRAGLTCANLFPEPLPMQAVIDSVRPGAATGPATLPAPRYDMGTRHAALFGGTGRHIMPGAEVLDAIGRFAAGPG